MSTRIHRSLNLFLLAASSVVFGMSGAPAQADDNWTVTGGDWYATGVEEPHPVPPVGSTLRTGQRISTARGQGIELSIGKNRIALDPNTVVIVGDDDPATKVGTFELVSGAIDVTVRKGEFVTIDAPRLKTTSKGADFSITTSDKDSEVIVTGGVVTVLSRANGASTEVGPDQVAIVGQKDLNERTGQPDPIILPVARTDATTPRVVAAASIPAGNSASGPFAKARVADPAWMVKLISEGKATPTWVVKQIAQATDDPANTFAPENLPVIGTILEPGMRIVTAANQRVKLTNGLDVVTIISTSAIVIGDGLAATDQPDFELLQGAMEIEVADRPADQTVTVKAPHLVATTSDAKCVVSMTSTGSGVYVKDGAVTVSSIATGTTQTVQAGVMAVVRPQMNRPQGQPQLPETMLELK